jgi:hypothetical protein
MVYSAFAWHVPRNTCAVLVGVVCGCRCVEPLLACVHTIVVARYAQF